MGENTKKKLLLMGAVLIAVVSLPVGWYFTLRLGVYVGDDFYYKVSDRKYKKNRSNYIERISDNEFRLISDTGEKTVSLKFHNDLATFDFSDGKSYEGYFDEATETFRDKEGMIIGWDSIQIVGGNEPKRISDRTYCVPLFQIYFDEAETRGIWYFQVLGIILYILGIITVLYPNEVHFFLTSWKYDYPELSESGLLMERVGGIVECLIGIAFMSGLVVLFMN